MTASSLVLSVVFGSVGMGYCIYGRSQQEGLWLVAGVALMAFPYVVSGWPAWGIGAAVAGAPFLLRRYM